ncbi:MAG: PAS domain S-box protein [Woronichinia naegeliana WA131]|uniref:PAS domain S-box protein n=1 Tax=Woronichinia naegeliana WA131 TaxID=2824559 RepID=A0A977L2Z4_9CYAN|nr:MAG: PAS domain S-box protein [Woronichinia naegeliana WA131]
MSQHPKHSPKTPRWPDKRVSQSYKILVVEDSESDRALYRRFLTSPKTTQDQPRPANYQLVEFQTGEEGLNWCQQQMPDIFLIDYFLPDMTGLEFLVKLRQQTGLSKIPVIILTSQGSTEIAVELLKNGAEDYLDNNQITEDNLQRAVSGVLKQFQLLKQLQESEAEREEGRFWRQVLNSLFSYVGILSPDGIFLEANQAPLVITGLTKESVIGKPFTEVYAWLEPTEAQTIITNAIEKASQGNRVRFELSITTADSHLGIMDFAINPLYDNQGRTTHLVLSGENISDRKQIEADLSELAAIVQSSGDAIISQSLDGKITSWNRSAEVLFGYTSQEMIGQSIRIIVPLDYQDEESYILEQIHQGKTMEHFKTIRQFKDGRRIHVSVSASPIRNKEDVIIGTSKIIRDITEQQKMQQERQQMEEALIQSEQQRRLALDLTRIGFWNLNLLTGEMIWNDNHFTLLGLVPGQIEPNYKVWEERLHPDDKERVEEQFSNSLKHQINYEAEYRVIHPDGSIHWCLGRGKAIYDQAGQPVRSLGVLLDINERKQIEIILQQQALVFENIFDGVIVVNLQGIIIDWNKGAERLFGYSKAEVLGQKPHLLHKPEEAVQLSNSVIEGTLRDGHWSGELPILRKDASEGICETNTILLRDNLEQVIAIIGVNRDITERKHNEKILQQKIKQEQLLFKVSQVIRQSLDLNQILETATQKIKEILDLDRVVIYRFNLDWSGDFIVESVNDNWNKLVKIDIPVIWQDTYLQENQGGRFRNHESFIIPDIYQANLQSCHIELLEAFQVKAYAVSPIFSGNLLWGLLGIYQNSTPRDWQIWEIDLLEQIANQLAIAIQQSELYEQLQMELKERQQAEDSLRQTKEQYELAIRASHDGFWDWDLVTNEIYYSPRWKEILGYKDYELPNTSHTWESLIFAEDYPLAIQLMEDYNLGKIDHFLTTVRFHHKDGSTIYIVVRAIHLKDNQGKVVRMIGTHSDITDMIQIQQKLESSKQFLQLTTEQLEERVKELKERNAEMLVISEINDFLQSCTTIEEICCTINTLIQPLFPNCSGGTAIINNSRNYLEMIGHWGTHLYSENLFEAHDCWALRRGKLHYVAPDHHKLFCSHINRQNPPFESICIPMIAQGETLGLFSVYSSKPDQLGDAKRQLAQTISEQVSAAIANLILREKLQNQSIRDPLTGLFNRRYLEEYLNKEIHRAARQQYPIGIVMIDLDHFKQVNDTFGHDAGDFILKEMGMLLKNSIRSSDTAYRYGGEEMLLILSESSLEATAQKAEEIRIAITQMSLKYHGNQTINLTSSFGVACFPDQGITINEIIHAADIGLYQAKEAGRNRVRVSSILL